MKLAGTISVDVEKERAKEIDSQLGRSLGRRAVLHSLLKRNVTSGAGNCNFSFPDLPHGGEDGTVYDRLSVPITRNEIHVFADHNSTIVNGERRTTTRKYLFDSDISRVRK